MKAWRGRHANPRGPPARHAPPPATMTDPMPAPIPRAHGQFRFQITVKGPSARILSRTLRKLVQEAGLGEDLTAVIDVDAMSFM